MSILDAGDAGSHDGGPCFSISHRAYRAVWGLTWALLGAWTPPPLRVWRILLLKVFGAKIDWTATVYGSTRVWFPKNLVMGRRASLGPRVNCYCIASITLGERALASQDASLCTGSHDIDDRNFQLFAKPIVLAADAWVAAEAFVGPGVTVGEGAVLGARGVTVKDLEPWTVYAGNPCRRLRVRARPGKDLSQGGR